MATTNPFDTTNAYLLYHMDGTVGSAAKIDNAEGTAARDLVENGAVTADTGTISPTTNGTYDGFGANKNLQVTNGNLSGWPTGSQTWEAWVKFDSKPTTSGTAFIASKNGTTAGTYIAIDATGNIIGQFSDGTTTKTFAAATSLNTGTWYYIAVVIVPSSSVTVYVNGVSDYTSSTGIPTSAIATSQDFYIGTQSNVVGDGTFSWTGDIDCFKLSTVAKTAQEIIDYYNDAFAGSSQLI